MKYKFIYTLSLFFLLISYANSQNYGGVTVEAGTIIANQKHYISDVDYTIETKPIIGAAAMLGYNHYINEKINIIVDIGYLRKGSTTEFESATINHLQNDELTINTGDFKKSTFDYFSINAGIQYLVFNQKPKIYLTGALRIDNLMSYKTESDYKVLIDNEIITGLNTGIGMVYSLGKFSPYFEVQKLFDFSQIMNSKGIELKNKAFSISAGIIYYLEPYKP